MLNFDVVQLGAGLLDHGFVGSSVHDEHEGVVVLDGLNGTFGAEWVLDDSVLVPGGLLLDTLSFVLGLSGKLQCLWSSKCRVGPDFVLSDCVGALLDSIGSSFGWLGSLRKLNQSSLTTFFDI